MANEINPATSDVFVRLFKLLAAVIFWLTVSLTWVSLLTTADAALADGHIQFKDEEVIQFDYDARFPAMIVPIDINGVQVNAILDTGANYFVLDDDFEAMLGSPLDPDEVYRITGFAPSQQAAVTHAGRVKVDYFRFPAARLGTRMLTGSISMTKDLDFISSVLGLKIGALIGAEQLAKMAVFFDNENNRIVVADSVKSFEFSSTAFERVDLRPSSTRLPMILGHFGDTTLPFIIDTGTNSFALLDKFSVEKLGATEKLLFEMQASIHAIQRSGSVRLKSMRIAGREFRSQLFGLGAFNSLGFAAIQHADFILSMPDRALYLGEPKSPIGRGEIDKSGLRLLTQQGSIFVFQVAKDSPAYLSGLRERDLVSTFNGESVSAYDIWTVREALSGKPETQIEIGVRRGNTEIQTGFKLNSNDLP